jgi:protein-S-isoprenylcysteine O-methyltransferase Ste14
VSSETTAYGLWSLVLINSVVFILFAYSFFKPRTGRDWRSFGAFSAFLVALFTEMYGFPLTIYLLSGWLQTHYPNIDWLSHDAGHLLEMMFGWKTNPHAGPFHILSFIFIGAGFILISAGWKVLYDAQQHHGLAASGHLARQEEREAQAQFGKEFDRYAARTPAWFPRLRGPRTASSPPRV